MLRITLKPNGEFVESESGRLFFDDQRKRFIDLSNVRLLRCGVDTVRQLYNGMIRPEVMALFEQPEEFVKFAGHQWAKGRVGRDSGYQYRLQNADMGVILLIKNHNVKLENIGAHLKFEISPHALDGADPAITQRLMDDLARALLTHCETNQCAVHLALDVQGGSLRATSWSTCIAGRIGCARLPGLSALSSTAAPLFTVAVRRTCSALPVACNCASTTKPSQARATDKPRLLEQGMGVAEW